MEQLLNFFKMVSDETRLRIIMLLYHEKLCVCEICGILKLSQPKVSRHLAKLRDTGLVKDERKEQFIYYYLDLQDPNLYNLIGQIAEGLDRFPQICKDISGINEKGQYIQSCKNIAVEL